MFKMIVLLKRRPGMSIEDFVTYYETAHAKLGASYLKPHIVRYARNCLRAMPNPLTGEDIEPECDVLTEVWFPDRAAWERSMAVFSDPAVAARMSEDEDRLFDRSRTRLFLIDGTHESNLST